MGSLNAINGREAELMGLSDEELKAKTSGLQERLRRGAKREDVLVEAFAVVREASKRVLGMRHYDVQVRSCFYVCLGHDSPRLGRGAH